MAENSLMWSQNPDIKAVDPKEKLFVFGYSCKIFSDDEKARYIDQGKHLIPWMGDDSLMIDRYDVRGYLHDLKQYEPKPGGYQEELDSEEEKLCDEERYRSLRSDLTEEQLYQEEELKRLRAAIAGDGAYHEIGFSYDNEVQSSETSESQLEEPEDEPFEAHEGLNIPKGLETPSTMKIHAIIEKTALFVSQQGGQMEIIIKMKQHANPQFGFMHLDNPLHPYYKFLVKQIKSGAYKPAPAKRVSRSEDEDDDGHYLHPSLMAGKKDDVPQFTVPSINFRRSQDDSYSVLVRNLKQQQDEEKIAREAEEEKNKALEEQRVQNQLQNGKNQFNPASVSSSKQSELPPPELQSIILKMAEYVAKNGEDFEYVVRSKDDKRFDFLQTYSPYYNYYIQLRNAAKARSTFSHTQSSESKMREPSGTASSYATNHPIQNEACGESVGFKPSEPVVDEFDALYTQDSQDFTLTPFAGNFSEDSVDSNCGLKSSKSKYSKVLKGPISFTLKPKEPEAPPPEKTKIPLLLDDSDEGSNGEGKEKDDKPKAFEEGPSIRQDIIEIEEKPKLTSEQEAKLAEELKKAKLFSAARERLLQHKKEKRMLMEQQMREEQLKKERVLQVEQLKKERELQLERKRKAALFLKMLKKRDPEQAETLAEKLGGSKKLKSRKLWEQGSSEGILTENGVLFPDGKICIKTTDQTSSSSDESGEEIMITEFSSNPDQLSKAQVLPQKEASPVKKEHKKKKKKHSRSRSKEKRSKSSKKERRQSKSPKSHKMKKEKKLPAAYALKRSRSRSRSPKRYRESPYSYWGHRR